MRLPGRTALHLSGMNSSLSSLLSSSDHLGRFKSDLLEGPATGGDREREGEGLGKVGEVMSNSGRGWVGTRGVGGTSSSIVFRSSACGRGLKISEGETVRQTGDNDKVGEDGLSSSSDPGRPQGELAESGESGGVLTASDISLRGDCGACGSSSSESYGRLMNSTSIYTTVNVCFERKLDDHTLFTSSSRKSSLRGTSLREFVKTNGDG